MSYTVQGDIYQNVPRSITAFRKTCKQAKCPSVEEWLSNGSVHPIQSRTAATMDRVRSPASTRINRLERGKKQIEGLMLCSDTYT